MDAKNEIKEIVGLEDQIGTKNYHLLDDILSRREGIWIWNKALKGLSMKDKIPKLGRINFFVIIVFCFGACAGQNNPQSESPNKDVLVGIVNPFDSTCYDWRDNIIPCDFKRPYVELLIDEPIPAIRFIDNKDGTVTDSLTRLIWLKNANCFGMIDWRSAIQAVKGLKEGDCGPNQALVLSDGSSAGDWRLPTMRELCTLIDFSRRDPALTKGHLFLDAPPGYHWSATTLDSDSEMAWIVYIESGTTCYEGIKNRAGHVWPVRGPLKDN